VKRNWLVVILLISITSVILFGCQNEGSTSDDRISVITSFYPMYEFTKQVAGDRADVTLMVSAGQDAHHYEPSAKDVARVNEADVFVYSSEDMEHWVSSLLKTIENDHLVIARAADGVDLANHDHGHSHHHETNHEATESIKINGVEHHYHTGDMIKLIAEIDEDVDYDHWHWYTRKGSEEEWKTVPNQFGPEFNDEAVGESYEVRAVLYDEAHNEFAQSEIIEIVIDNHHGHDQNHDHERGSEETAAKVAIIGLADHYHTGDVVTLVAKLKDETDLQNWHWFTRENHYEEWEVVTGQETDHFEYKTSGKSFEVKAVLYDHNHNVYAESEPVSVRIDNHDNRDPHIWLDPVLAQEQVKVIRDALIQADPDGKDIYEKNAEAFIQELQELHKNYESAFKDAKNRVFVVQHQAFGYLAKRYHLEQIAIGGLSTEVEPSPSRIAEIGDLVKEYNVPVIYYQQGANSAIAQTVANETGTEIAVLYDLEVVTKELHDKNLGYLDAMRENLKSLQLSIQ
jgi:zinc transport system substrate-binding protein